MPLYPKSRTYNPNQWPQSQGPVSFLPSVVGGVERKTQPWEVRASNLFTPQGGIGDRKPEDWELRAGGLFDPRPQPPFTGTGWPEGGRSYGGYDEWGNPVSDMYPLGWENLIESPSTSQPPQVNRPPTGGAGEAIGPRPEMPWEQPPQPWGPNDPRIDPPNIFEPPGWSPNQRQIADAVQQNSPPNPVTNGMGWNNWFNNMIAQFGHSSGPFLQQLTNNMWPNPMPQAQPGQQTQPGQQLAQPGQQLQQFQQQPHQFQQQPDQQRFQQDQLFRQQDQARLQNFTDMMEGIEPRRQPRRLEEWQQGQSWFPGQQWTPGQELAETQEPWQPGDPVGLFGQPGQPGQRRELPPQTNLPPGFFQQGNVARSLTGGGGDIFGPLPQPFEDTTVGRGWDELGIENWWNSQDPNIQGWFTGQPGGQQEPPWEDPRMDQSQVDTQQVEPWDNIFDVGGYQQNLQDRLFDSIARSRMSEEEALENRAAQAGFGRSGALLDQLRSIGSQTQANRLQAIQAAQQQAGQYGLQAGQLGLGQQTLDLQRLLGMGQLGLGYGNLQLEPWRMILPGLLGGLGV